LHDKFRNSEGVAKLTHHLIDAQWKPITKQSDGQSSPPRKWNGWQKPFLINAQLAHCVFVLENCAANETPTKWQSRQKKGSRKKEQKGID